MKRHAAYIVVVEYNGYRHVAGATDTLEEARQLRATQLERIKKVHKGSRLGANGSVRILSDAVEARKAPARGDYLKSWF